MSPVSLKVTDALHRLEGFLQTSNLPARPPPAWAGTLFSSWCFPAWASCFSSPINSLMSSFWNGPGGQEMLPLPQNMKMFNGNMHTTNTIPYAGTSWDYSVISLIRYFRFINIIFMVSATVESIHQIKSEWALLFVGLGLFLQMEHV